MRHVVVFVVVTSIIGSYQLFELPLALLASSDGRGPDNAGLTVVTYLYEVGFNAGDLGLGSADRLARGADHLRAQRAPDPALRA